VTEEGRTWLDRPPSVEAALLYFSALPAMMEAPRLSSLVHLEISVVGLPRAERLTAAQQLSAALPRLLLGVSPRGRGSYA
jgi:hypothetical protein